ncbi:ABC transporter ATP-binding protein [Nesterenkonia ebinurensis]|uniref:ABC transporter ATP-binding protein n=1 Tax=Nesterenkonia ebinurensis TaxID=2608252 RepID=UPI00123D141D|nr:ABC transporter ATP-binding protein [Nesterenkonia ebinurensis]
MTESAEVTTQSKGGYVLEVDRLVTEFDTPDGTLRAVNDVSFGVRPGETVCIVGESGSGKSTTMLSALGLIKKDGGRIAGGEVRFNGENLLRMSKERLRRIRGREIGMIFQDPMSSLNPVFTVGDQLVEAVRLHQKVNRAQARKRAIGVLSLVGVPNPEVRFDQYPHQYSGGMRQRAMIAMAIINDPAVLVADEPTTALDVTIQAQVLRVLAKAQKETGSATILITHDLGVVAETADRVLVMYGGRIIEQGDVETVFKSPKHPYTVGLLNSQPRIDENAERLKPIPGEPPNLAALPSGCVFSERCGLRQGREACTSEEPSLQETGESASHSAACHFWPEVRPPVHEQETISVRPKSVGENAPAETVLEVTELKKHFKTSGGLFKRGDKPVRAVDGVSFDLRSGETLGLVGESGSGKTTVGKAALGLVGNVDGTIVFLGKDIARYGRSHLRPIRKDLQMVFQDPYGSLDPRMNVRKIITEPMWIHGIAPGENGVEHLLERVGLRASIAERYPHQLSGGQRQRVGIARALGLRPRVMVLDEPVSALDVSVQAQVINLLKEIQAEDNIAYLFVAHDLAVVHNMSDRVAIMYLGKIMEIGDRAEVYKNPTHPYTQALLSAVPIPDPGARDGEGRIVLKGDIPNPSSPPSGCVFRTRCWKATEKCAIEVPALEDRLGIGHPSACHYPDVPQKNHSVTARV